MSLSPLYSRRSCMRAGTFSSEETTSTAKSAPRSALAWSSSSSAFGRVIRAFFASKTILPRAGPSHAPIDTTTSPFLPVASRRSPTASATSPSGCAMASIASKTSSSKERPLAVPRSRSASSSPAASFSARARASSACMTDMRSSTARSRSDCWSKACFITAIDWRWKAASGLEGSSAANWRRRSSRTRTIASSMTAFTRCWTAAEESSEKCLASSRDRWPFSGPSASSTFALKYSATERAFSVNAASTFSASTRKCSTPAPVCSRSRTRAPISIASRMTRAGSSASRASATAHSSSTTSPSMSRRSPRMRTEVEAKRGVAASMARTGDRTPVTGRNYGRCMSALSDALEQGASPARLRALLEAELARGAQELARKRSGYEDPVIVAVGADAQRMVGAAPVPPTLRADPHAVDERAWLLVAALAGALVVAGGPGLRAGAVGGHLALSAPAGDAELAALAFDENVARVDRLRAREVVMPELEAADLKEPIGATHPLRVAEALASQNVNPADPREAEQHEDAVLAALGAAHPEVTRPHEDPDPGRRVARRILQRLNGMGKWGGYHTEFTHLPRGFAGNDRELATQGGERLVDAGLLPEKPSVGQRPVFLNPRPAKDIYAPIDEGRLPPGLSL